MPLSVPHLRAPLALLLSAVLFWPFFPGHAAEPPVGEARVAFLQEVENHFAEWDTDHDGRLSLPELDAAVEDGRIHGKQSAALAALKRASHAPGFTLTPLTVESIHALVEKPLPGRPNLPAMFQSGLRKIEKSNRVLFATGAPHLETIRQGKLGNCFTLAPLGALTAGRPEVVKGMFHLLEDGGYEVTLGKQTVRVAAPTDAEVAIISSTGGDGLWVNVYEKAAGQARNNRRPEAQRTAVAIDALAKGGSAGTMLAFITGHEITRFSCQFAQNSWTTPEERERLLDALRGQLSAALQEGRLMTCGTVKTTTPGLTPHHAYAVLGYDAITDHIKLWNPHGDAFTPKGPAGLENGYPRSAGVFQMPLPEFVQQFSGLAFEQWPKA